MRRARWLLGIVGLCAVTVPSCGSGPGACWWIATAQDVRYAECVNVSSKEKCKEVGPSTHFEEGSCCSPYGDGAYGYQFCGY